MKKKESSSPKKKRSKIALGTAQFGMSYGLSDHKSGPFSLGEVEDILDTARKNNIKTIDTAISYGESETLLGKAGVEDFNVISKIPTIPLSGNMEAWIRESVLSSLKRLNIKRLSTLLLHDPSQILSDNGFRILETLRRIKDLGLINRIGISSYSLEEVMQIVKIFDIDVVQIPINILDGRIKSQELRDLSKQGIEIHARSVFLQGLLLNPFNLDNRFDLWKKELGLFWEWCESNELLPIEACIGHVNNINEIDKIIIGIDSLDHLREIISLEEKNFLFPEDLKLSDANLLNPSLWKEKKI